MNKEIRYSGYTAVPSDYDNPDGDLSCALNLIPEDGAIHPIPSPQRILSLADGFQVLVVHNTDSFYHFIIMQRSTGALFSVDRKTVNPDTILSGKTLPPSFATISIQTDTNIEVETIGNIVVIATSLGMNYYLWEIETQQYKSLGNHIPEIDMEFALKRCVTPSVGSSSFSVDMEDDGSIMKALNSLIFANYDGIHPGRRVSRPLQAADQQAFKFISDSIIGGYNKYASEVNANGHFLMPFFVRYAYRLYDGSNVMLSPPVLMLPTTSRPLIKAGAPTVSDSIITLQNEIVNFESELCFRILSDTNVIQNWKTIIKGIDIFISKPIYTFDASEDLVLRHRISSSSDGFKHFGDSTTVDTRAEDSNFHRNPTVSVSEAPNQYDLDSFQNCETKLNVSSSGPYWIFGQKTAEEMEAEITSNSLFYKIAELDIEDIYKSQNFVEVEVMGSSLNNLLTRPVLSDEIYSHHKLIPKFLYGYNARLNLANVSYAPFPGFSIRTLTQYTTQGKENAKFEPISIYVKLRNSDRVRWANISIDSKETGVLSAYSYDSISSQFPRWLFYPDNSAVEMILANKSGYYRIALKQHDFINGAYWFRGLSDASPEFIDGALPDDLLEAIRLDQGNVPLPNRVFLSEPNNPFSFPIQNIISMGTGAIRGISSAAKALSQGQFGQFPLYAFCTDGIWAIEVSSTGTYSARQPISRDVLSGSNAIAQLDSSVLFVADRGIMLIAGSTVQCISETIDTDFPFIFDNLPHINKILPNYKNIVPFKQFAQSCQMAYDYTNQRIYLFNNDSSSDFAFVYSLKSHLWGMHKIQLDYTLNSYPEAYALSKDGQLLNLSVPSQTLPQFLITRPLKLDGPDILKTIDTVIQRGNFQRGHVQSVLYGSRDLINWHLVWSSQDHYLRGFRGTPYKYFRIALLCNLSPGESISGASIQFTPRLTNRPR